MIRIKRIQAFPIVNGIIILMLSFIFLFPFWRVLMMSLNDPIDLGRGGINFLPRVFSLENYINIFHNPTIGSAYKITISRTVLGTLLHVIMCSLMAFSLSRDHFKPRKIINVMLIITMFFNGGLVPTFLLYRQLGLVNNFWIYIIPAIYGTGSVFILRAGFRTLPKELINECPKLDGASDLIIFFRIALPLSLPMLATITLFTAVGHWNDYMTAVLFIQNRDLVPMQTVLYRMLTTLEVFRQMQLSGARVTMSMTNMVQQTPQSIKMTTIIITAMPIIMVYPFLQRYFIKGIFIGSIKG